MRNKWKKGKARQLPKYEERGTSCKLCFEIARFGHIPMVVAWRSGSVVGLDQRS